MLSKAVSHFGQLKRAIGAVILVLCIGLAIAACGGGSSGASGSSGSSGPSSGQSTSSGSSSNSGGSSSNSGSGGASF